MRVKQKFIIDPIELRQKTASEGGVYKVLNESKFLPGVFRNQTPKNWKISNIFDNFSIFSSPFTLFFSSNSVRGEGVAE